MSADAAAAAPADATARGGAGSLALLVGGVGAATVAGVVLGGGSPALALGPVLAVAAAYVLVKAPVRTSTSVLLFVLLALEVNTDAGGMWHTPLSALGDLLTDNLEVTLRMPGVKLSGVDVVVLVLLGVCALRKLAGSDIGSAGQVQTAAMMRGAVLLYVASVAWAFGNGLATGGTLAIWQLRRLLHVPFFFAVFAVAFRGPADHALLGRIVVAAACVKAALAVAVQRIAIAETGGKLAYATNHGDSILLSLAILIVLVDLVQRPRRGARLAQAVVLLALLLVGSRENGRRLVWVQLAMSVGVVYLLSPPARWKRTIARAVVVGSPVALLYFAAGWNSSSGVFAPVQTLRSVVDGSTDRSTLWRDVENWNICMSLRERPFLGIGLGKEYTEHTENADISVFYSDYRFWPHNSTLGLLLFTGIAGYTGISVLLAAVVFLGARSLRLASRPIDRTAALCCIGAVVICMSQSYGDLGASFTQYRVLLGLAAAVAGKLAVATGAWPVARTPPRTAIQGGAATAGSAA